MNGQKANGTLLRDVNGRPIHWLLAGLVVLTSAIHVYIGLLTEQTQFVVLGLAFVAGLLVFFTRYFQPVLYLIGAGYVVFLTVVWVLAGMPFVTVALLDKAVQIILFGLFVYLFFAEERMAGS